MSTRSATTRARPRRAAAAPPRGAAPRRPGCSPPCVVAARGRGRDRRPRRRQGGQGDRAAAAPRGHHPPAGRRQGPRPGADRGRDLRRVALPRPDLARGRQGPDAAAALDRRRHRAQVRRHRLRPGRPRRPADQHLLRLVLPALPARAATAATACSRSPPTTPARARSTSGSSRPATAARTFDRARHIPFPETRHYVEQVLEMRGRYRERYKRELGL